jgi:hypothetical protein
VKLYAGYDPVSGRHHYIDAVVSAGPRAWAEAERVRTRLLHEVDEQRNPKTHATVDQLLDHYLKTLDVEPTTRTRYEGIIRIHLRPALGRLPLEQARQRPGSTDSSGSCVAAGNDATVAPSTSRTERSEGTSATGSAVVVPCQPLSASSVRQTHWVLNAALAGAVRWRWIGHNLLEANSPPPPPASNPSPPSAHEASRLFEEAFGTDRSSGWRPRSARARSASAWYTSTRP